jgi:hypothetical protein
MNVKAASYFAPAFTWHLDVQFPFVSNAAPPARWHDPQEVFAASAVLCMFAFQFRGAFASCGHSAGWQTLHSSFSRLECAAWSYVTLPFFAAKTIFGGGAGAFFSWATMAVSPIRQNMMGYAIQFRMACIISDCFI